MRSGSHAGFRVLTLLRRALRGVEESGFEIDGLQGVRDVDLAVSVLDVLSMVLIMFL